MARRFNVSGECNPERHYMLPPLRRLPMVRKLIEDQAYFVLHAPRQSGKTTAVRTLASELTAEGRYTSVVLSQETGAADLGSVGAAELAILDDWRPRINLLPTELHVPAWPDAPEGRRLGAALNAWASTSSRPLVLFLDEIDALQGPVLVSILRQLRSGFGSRPQAFPQSIGLVGMRDVRDYLMQAGGSGRTGSASPFNIKDESLTLRNFTRDEVAELYAQHTADTGQTFEPAAVDRAFELSGGHPWLVNALARQMVEVLVPNRSRSLTLADADDAAKLLIERRDTHLDSLSERLLEPRVRVVIEPILQGDPPIIASRDDVEYAVDLGLIRRTRPGGVEIANPIYGEIIPRELASRPLLAAATVAPTWLRADGRLDPPKLLEAFVAFWRQHGEVLMKAQPYHEAAPHLVAMAFLQRVENGGGPSTTLGMSGLVPQYAIGTGRMDLCLRYGPDTLGIELKVWSRGKDPLVAGLKQIDGYLAGLPTDAKGWLVIFDRRPDQPPVEERTSASTERTPSGREVVVVRA